MDFSYMVSATTWIFRQQHSPEHSPESPLSAFLASVLLFPKDGPLLPHLDVLSEILPVAVDWLVPTAEIWECFTPLPTLKTWTLCFMCLLSPVSAAPHRLSHHTSTFHFLSFLTTIISAQVMRRGLSLPKLTLPHTQWYLPIPTLTSPPIIIQLPDY